MAGGADPAVSVVVSDYQEGPETTWHTERSILEGLSRQGLAELFEVILVESDQRSEQPPRDLEAICPGCRVVYAPATQSATLKDEGAGYARADLIAVFEADCVPDPSWLGVLVDVQPARPPYRPNSARSTRCGGR